MIRRILSSLSTNKRGIGSFAVMFLSLGCVLAYFDFMFYAAILWIIGFAVMNVHVFVLSGKKP